MPDLKFLFAAATHEREQATILARHVDGALAKVERAKTALAAAREAVPAAKARAAQATARADATCAALTEAAAAATPAELAAAGIPVESLAAHAGTAGACA